MGHLDKGHILGQEMVRNRVTIGLSAWQRKEGRSPTGQLALRIEHRHSVLCRVRDICLQHLPVSSRKDLLAQQQIEEKAWRVGREVVEAGVR